LRIDLLAYTVSLEIDES